MNKNQLMAVSPIDGRYKKQTEVLGTYFSEYALMKYRTHVEIEYFIALCEIPLPQLLDFPKNKIDALRKVASNFDIEDGEQIKKIESTTNHDVKAVEYFIKNKFDKLELDQYKEFIHFGLTSQDINNTAFPLMWKEALQNVYIPELESLCSILSKLAEQWDDIPMLARTHGQPASPTRLGKEIKVFEYRLNIQIQNLKSVPHTAKFGGATGNFNAHKVAYPNVDWRQFAEKLLTDKLALSREQYTTQISNYDQLAASFDALKRIHTIIIDMTRDFWQYISMDFFKQKIKEGEVGSSAMPHKVNPIDFENAEGNLGIANALLEHLATKLPISRLQRDLTDSTVIRNIGMPLAHGLIALKSTTKGLNKLLLNSQRISKDLDDNWAVVAEAIQTILRREGYPEPYEALKVLTRTNEAINEDSIKKFINKLNVSERIKTELNSINPHNYTGV